MASSVSPYEQKLRLVDAFEEHKFYFSKAHFLFLIQESLELTRGGPEKLKYILDLASRCKKSGIVSIELLAKQIDHEYSLTPLLHGQEGGVNGSRGQGCGDMETENGEGGGEEDEEQDDQEEGEVRTYLYGRSSLSCSRFLTRLHGLHRRLDFTRVLSITV